MNWSEFLLELLRQLSNGDFIVNVKNDKGQLIPAKVIGYSDYNRNIEVEFISNTITEKQYIKIERKVGFGYTSEDEDPQYEWKDVPVKHSNINYKYICLKTNTFSGWLNNCKN